ncbi:MFS transporter [Actinoplanes sp. RD1]|uniref:MFS transporter n=1 Tax=Actinoplanes sp. RD1 TaxID=3064538 RepID=UPI002740D2E4|nr:MFS transporter [Actinoplanes sp. RD1]
MTTIAARRTGLFLLFFIPGLLLSSWVTRTPDVRDLLDASTAEMGIVLFGLSAGSMLGVLGSGAFVSRFGARPVITVGISAVLLGMPVIALGAHLSQSVLVGAGLFLCGFGIGGGEVAMNVDGADVERVSGRILLPTLHGFYSLGTVLGAATGMLLTLAGLPVVWHLLIVTAIAVPVAVFSVRRLPYGVGRQPRRAPAAEQAGTPAPKLWREPALLLIGAIVLALALAEGAANDWLPLIMVDGHDLSPALSSGVYLVFNIAMATGRFVGGWLLRRFTRPVILCASAVTGAIGLLLIIVVDNQAVASGAALLWGLGAALGFPVALSAAADSGSNSTARVSLVASLGYVAFLVGPPALGFIGDHYSLRSAMILVLALVTLAAVLAPAMRARNLPSPGDGNDVRETGSATAAH